jgi:hypothetical protein
MHSNTIASILALSIGLGQAYKVDFYKGEQCRGAPLGSIKPPNYDYTFCSDTSTEAQSAYITHNNKNDDSHQLLFFSKPGCTTDVVTGVTGPGCVTFDGGIKAVQTMKLGRSKRHVLPDNGRWMNSVHTVNNMYRMNNFTVSSDNEDMDSNWLNIGLGKWIGVPENMTTHQYAHELEAMDFVERAWGEDDLMELINETIFPEPDPFDDYPELLPGTSPIEGSLARRQQDSFVGVRCNRAARCAFATGQAIQTTYNGFAKIYDGLGASRLWGFLNNGYVVSAGTHYLWNRTDKKLKASTCDKNDKQCLLDALRDNFNEFPKRASNVRTEEVENFEQDVTGKSEWQTSTTKPMKAMPFQC